MSSLSPTEIFHQMVLFQMMDYRVPAGYEWIAVDDKSMGSGASLIFIYSKKPTIADDWMDGFSVSSGDRRGTCLVGDIIIPDDVSWRDCVWKI